MNPEEKKARVIELREELARLEAEVDSTPESWQLGSSEYYGLYHATSGITLGIVGAIASLLFNIIGSLIVGQHPLRIIQVYLTFPLGQRALEEGFDNGMAIALGCCLYIGTGMLLGIPFQMAIARFIPNADLVKRMLFATILGLVIWGVNIYGILSWLQPILIGGNWIADANTLPPWVAAATHLVFAWTMAYVYPWGNYQPYLRQTRTAAN